MYRLMCLVRMRKCWPSLQAGGSGWDVYVPTNYTITTYVSEDLIEPLDVSRKLPNYDPSAFDAALCRGRARVDGTLYAVPKNWGTTGYAVNTQATPAAQAMTSWKDFFDMTMDRFLGPDHGA